MMAAKQTMIVNEVKTDVPRPRLLWFDTARGIGIILVVYAHVLRGQTSAKLLALTPIEQLQDHAIYAFHMPFFFLLSGLFAGTSVRSPASFIRRRLATIVYPYLLWSILQTLLSIAASRFANRPGRWEDLLQIAAHPIGQFWFLYVLAILQFMLLLPRPIFYLLIPIGISLVAWFNIGPIPALVGWYLPFFAAGVFLGARRLEDLLPQRAAWFWVFIGLALFVVLFAIVPAFDGAAGLPRKFGLAASGIVMILGVSRLLDGRIPLINSLGVASLAIFVLHVICGAAIRATLVRLGATQPDLQVVVITLGGLLIPLGVYRLSITAGLTTLLGLGAPPASPARTEGS